MYFRFDLKMGFDAGGGPQYGNLVGGIFVFNLIVGVGALSLPNAFAFAGLFPAIGLLLFLGFFAYITVTFLLESISIANAVITTRDKDTDQVRIALASHLPRMISWCI